MAVTWRNRAPICRLDWRVKHDDKSESLHVGTTAETAEDRAGRSRSEDGGSSSPRPWSSRPYGRAASERTCRAQSVGRTRRLSHGPLAKIHAQGQEPWSTERRHRAPRAEPEALAGSSGPSFHCQEDTRARANTELTPARTMSENVVRSESLQSRSCAFDFGNELGSWRTPERQDLDVLAWSNGYDDGGRAHVRRHPT